VTGLGSLGWGGWDDPLSYSSTHSYHHLDKTHENRSSQDLLNLTGSTISHQYSRCCGTAMEPPRGNRVWLEELGMRLRTFSSTLPSAILQSVTQSCAIVARAQNPLAIDDLGVH
jgi:hypothetical protein